MRFRAEFERLEAELSLAGHVVLAPTALAPSTELSVEERARLGRIHLQKVEMVDEVLVVNVGGYVGESTRREIEHARSRGVLVSFLEPPGQPASAPAGCQSWTGLSSGSRRSANRPFG